MAEKLSIENIDSAIADGSLNEKVLSRTLDELHNYAYNHLYKLQEDVVDICATRTYYRRFTDQADDVFSGIEFRTYKAFNILKPFIHYNYRLSFRRSPLYNTPLTNADVDKHRDIFVYNYLVLINGNLDTSAKIRCKEELTTVCLHKDYMDEELAKQFVNGAAIDVLFLRNSYFIDTAITKENFELGNGAFALNGGTQQIKPGSKVMAFVYKNGGLKRLYNANYANGVISVDPRAKDYFEAGEVMNLKLVVITNFDEEFDIPLTETHFAHTEHPMPLPKKNVLMFHKNEDGSLAVDSRDLLTEKYPNVFELARPADRETDMVAMTFYWDNEANELMHYETDLGSYQSLINILDAYKGSNIPEVIKDFKPFQYTYDTIEYNGSDYYANDGAHGPLSYKANKLNSIFKLWAYASQLYHENLREEYNGYIIDMEGRDLEDKLRTDNRGEIVKEYEQIDFPEPMYLFVFSNDDAVHRLPFKFWIDGLRYVPEYVFLDGTYQYVYIEKRLITPKTVIEIEKSVTREFRFDQTINFMPNDLKIPQGFCAPFKSIFILDEKENYCDMSQFKFKVEINGKWYKLNPNSSYMVTPESKITVSSNDDYATTYRIVVYDRPMEFNKHIDAQNYVKRNINQDGIIKSGKPDPKRIRIFKRGLLLSADVYDLKFPKHITEPFGIDLTFDKYINEYQVDYIPEGYVKVYHQDIIDPKGIVNLNGKLKRPFSNKYYDVYVNGRKLIPRQVEKVANFGIVLKELNVLRNLDIYEKDMYGDYYAFDAAGANFISDILLKDDPIYHEALQKTLETMIDDKSIPTADSMFDAIENFVMDIIERHLQYNVINAMDDVDEETWKRYKDAFDPTSPAMIIDGDRDYLSSNGGNDDVFFLAPQTPDENVNINDPFYIQEFKKLISSLAGHYVDGMLVEHELHEGYPTVERTEDENVLIDGNDDLDRFHGEGFLMDADVEIPDEEE